MFPVVPGARRPHCPATVPQSAGGLADGTFPDVHHRAVLLTTSGRDRLIVGAAQAWAQS